MFLSSVVFSTISISPTRAATPGYFGTLPPGSALPDDAACAARVRRHPWEPRPENYRANHTMPSSFRLPAWGGVAATANERVLPRVTGGFTGTTDEILQWAACKWGFDEDTVRAVAQKESSWSQGALGDYTNQASKCAPGYNPPCPESFGIGQVRHTAHPGTFPASRESTAFNLDYTLAWRRACFEGHVAWLHEVQPGAGYGSGDEWGCVGFWFAGRWNVDGGRAYIAAVQQMRAERAWLTWPDKSVGLPSPPPAAPPSEPPHVPPSPSAPPAPPAPPAAPPAPPAPSPVRFPDVAAGDPAAAAISGLAERGIVRGYPDGRFGPGDPVTRAQMAALICRAMGWDAEDHGNPFPDRGEVDGDLWRNVGALAARGVVRGYPDGSYDPEGAVLGAQLISYITRAMIARGHWQQQPDNPALYPEIPAASTHRQDLMTYNHYVKSGIDSGLGALWPGWDRPITRAGIALALWNALEAHYGAGRVPR